MPDNLSEDQGKLRVLIAGTLPPPLGGMATYYQTLLNSSLPKQVDLCFVQTSSQKRELSSSGRATFSNLISAISDCARFTWAVVTNHPQIVHIGTANGLSFLKHSYCVWIARVLGRHVLLHPHCSLTVLYFEQPKWWQWFFRQVIHWTNCIIVLSKEWIQLSSIVPGCHVYYLPNAIDLKLYHKVAEKIITQEKSDGPCKILYLGYIGQAKGSFDILSAAVNVRSRGVNMVFNLVGAELTPGELKLIREQIIRLDLENPVKLHMPVYDKEKIGIFLDTDIFIYPSYHEGLPVAVLEAMACGLPIVASSVGGLPDLIQDGVNGILVEPGKPDQLAAALCKLASDHELCVSMGKASYQLAVEQYDIEQHVKQLVCIYKKTLGTTSSN